jgi:hypothetical protein
MKAIVLKHREWERIFQQVRQDYADTPSVYLIQSRMQKDLGWSYREHYDWKQYTTEIDSIDYRDSTSRIHIDFYSEEARTFFMLRYLNRDEN